MIPTAKTERESERESERETDKMKLKFRPLRQFEMYHTKWNRTESEVPGNKARHETVSNKNKPLNSDNRIDITKVREYWG